ncbi:acetylornithine deacetylase/succinyldiaminopimelate desuccinylase-like deacylase [Belliella baltica DSM 15883]|uniref:Acetylornithine deacetylase/succinyldiaminopimelate desuccinylase-like deacylase n=1 Tax=Belliella baltica (strain DSM 15883 / CIP 108006 / LMG 21964 / BA134) TaxID=866536 RepID=I3Z7J4_BELBD|nr:M20 family metallo-hydrolase [Belliella baltica]AFL85212.1 acetylornithine deacetylase/succinyldiaminopimelate desuccinylase-like deacylase [Belliella baltica DSM 15883]
MLPSASEISTYAVKAIALLEKLIATPSLSKLEAETAKILEEYLDQHKIAYQRVGNNIIAKSKHFDSSKPSILLNSHHDTVKPNEGYTKNPFEAIKEDEKIFGLGSNDAGGCLVSLIETFLHFYSQEMPYNLILIASAEEEISGKNGIESLLHLLSNVEVAIVGEPTKMQVAVAEKGLMVIDAVVRGKAGHAAREEGENAIYKALEDLNIVKSFEFKRKSEFLGKTKVTATIINSGTQHNVIPDICTYTLDVRVTDSYTLEEAFKELQNHLQAELKPRSLRLNSSKIPSDHKIHKVIKQLNLVQYGSPTLSDQALIPYPSIKIGPGDSARSHTADEYIFISEIHKGIEGYINVLNSYIYHQD